MENKEYTEKEIRSVFKKLTDESGLTKLGLDEFDTLRFMDLSKKLIPFYEKGDSTFITKDEQDLLKKICFTRMANSTASFKRAYECQLEGNYKGAKACYETGQIYLGEASTMKKILDDIGSKIN